MNTKIISFAMMVATVCFVGIAWAAPNYSGMSTVELSHLRYKIQSASPKEQKKFDAEWQKRLRAMPDDVKSRHLPDEYEKMINKKHRK